jgi:hypothetical protein
MIFFYFLGSVLVLKIPPEKAARIPFEVEPVIRMAWLFGLIPALSGLGQIIAGLFIHMPRPTANEPALSVVTSQLIQEMSPPSSVTEQTTELLESSSSGRSPSGVAQPVK